MRFQCFEILCVSVVPKLQICANRKYDHISCYRAKPSLFRYESILLGDISCIPIAVRAHNAATVRLAIMAEHSKVLCLAVLETGRINFFVYS